MRGVKLKSVADHWEYLGLGAGQYAYINALVFMRTSFGVDPFGMFWLLVPMIIAISVSMLSLRGGRLEPTFRIIASVACVASYLLGGVFVWSGIQPLAGTALMGFGCSFMWLAWGVEAASLPEGHMIAAVLVSIALASLISAGCYHFGVSPLVVGATLIAVSALLYIRAGAAPAMQTRDKGRGYIGYRAIRFSYKLVAGILSLLFAVSLSYHVAYGTFLAVEGQPFPIQYMEEVLVALALLAVFALSVRVGVLTIVRIVLPLAILSLLAMEFTSGSSALPFVLLWGTAMKLGRPFLLIVLLRLTQGPDGRDPWILFGLGILTMVLAQLIGWYVSPFINMSVPVSVTKNCLTLLLVLVVSVFVLSRDWYASPIDDRVDLADNKAGIARLARNCRLTDREIETLLLLVEGMSEQEIADAFVVSRGTVHTHVAHIYKKFDVHSKAELASVLEDAIH